MTCYYPDGSVATDHIPCNATASNTTNDASACCAGYNNDYCLANGLCWLYGTLSRGSCTDRTWASSSCAQWCQSEQRNTSMNIFPCHRVGVFQCEWDDDCPSNFTLEEPEIAIVIRDDQQPNASNAIAFADPNAKFVAVSRTDSPSSIATTASSTSSITAIASPTSARAILGSTAIPAASPSISSGAKAGIAVGVVIIVLAIGSLIYFAFVRQRWFMHVRSTGSAKKGQNTGYPRIQGVSERPELTDQASRVEMDALDVRPELTAQIPRWEMDSGRQMYG